MAPRRIFVYGTLRRGECNAGLMQDATFLREATSRAEFTLYALKGHPGMGRGGHTAVRGEVYEVNAATLSRLDALEQHPTWYARVPITLADGEIVETYLLPERFTAGHPVIASGDWIAWRHNET